MLKAYTFFLMIFFIAVLIACFFYAAQNSKNLQNTMRRFFLAVTAVTIFATVVFCIIWIMQILYPDWDYQKYFRDHTDDLFVFVGILIPLLQFGYYKIKGGSVLLDMGWVSGQSKFALFMLIASSFWLVFLYYQLLSGEEPLFAKTKSAVILTWVMAYIGAHRLQILEGGIHTQVTFLEWKKIKAWTWRNRNDYNLEIEVAGFNRKPVKLKILEIHMSAVERYFQTYAINAETQPATTETLQTEAV